MVDDALIGAWDLAGDGHDGSGGGHDAVPVGAVTFGSSAGPGSGPGRSVARIENGLGRLEVGGIRGSDLGASDLSLTAWVNAAASPGTGLGDIAACFDTSGRRGFTLGIHHGGSGGTHGNDRNLFFGMDSATEPTWTDHGRPGSSTIMICGLSVHGGELYAATWEGAPTDRGHVYRLERTGWVDCGTPWSSNAVTRLAVHDGDLYAGVSRLKSGGSAMPESVNPEPGGRILRYTGGTEWVDCGQLDGADSITALISFEGALYAAPMYSEGVYRMEAPGRWVSCGSPGRRLLALSAFGGGLYGAGNDHADVESAIAQTAAGIVVPARSATGGGGVFRYAGGSQWTSLGLQPDTTQVYAIEAYDGQMFIGTWPTGLVFRHAGDDRWVSTGRLGDETEVMNVMAFNGMLYAGTLPLAQIYRYDGQDDWALVGTVDRTPDVRYRRAASTAVFRGELYCGTLPSGHIHSMRTGHGISVDRGLATGWHHLAAVRSRGRAALFIDGVLAAEKFDSTGSLDFSSDAGLVLGGGPRSGFDGELALVRLYRRALTDDEILASARQPVA